MCLLGVKGIVPFCRDDYRYVFWDQIIAGCIHGVMGFV